MFRSLFAFELKYAFRQISTIGLVVAFFALGVLGTRANFGGQDINVNSPYAIAYYMALMTLFSLVALTVVSANVLLRDSRSRLEEIVFSSSVTKANYLGVRFAGIVTTTMAIYCASCLGLMAGLLITNPERLGPFSLWHYAQPLFVFGLPNVLFGASILFACATLFRSTMAVYVGGALIYILYVVGSIAGNSPLMANANLDGPQNDLLPVLLDPFGLVGFMSQARFWTAAEQNQLTVPLDGPFLINRLMWPAISLALAGLVYHVFAFRTLRSRRKRGHTLRDRDPTREVATASYHQLTPVESGNDTTVAGALAFELYAVYRSTLLQARIAVRSIPFAVLMLLWVFLASIMLTERLRHGSFDTTVYATTGQIVTLLLGSLSQLGVFVVVFYAAELFWTERQVRIDGLIDAAPTLNVVTIASKVAALGIVIALFVTVGIVTGIGVQVVSGYTRFEFPVYASLYYYAGLPLLLVGMFAIAVQNVMRNKYAALLLTVAIVVVSAQPRAWGLEHPLLRFAAMPTLTFSDMSGFGFESHPFHAYVLYWGSLSVALFCLTAIIWQRGTPQGVLGRVRSARFRSAHPGGEARPAALLVMATVFALVVCCLSGAYIYQKTNVEQTYQTIQASRELRASYERTYRSWLEKPQPTISRVKTQLHLFPDARRYELSGTYEFVNRDDQRRAITTFVVTLPTEVRLIDLHVPGADSISSDVPNGTHVVHLSRPLHPDSAGSLRFSAAVRRSGFSIFNSENSILENGTYIEVEDALPHFGYDAQRELSSRDDRTAFGLGPRNRSLLPEDAPASSYALVDYDATISAPSDQTLVTVGELDTTWVEMGRSYYRYRAPKPMNFQFALALARYDVVTANRNGVTYEVYHHPAHAANVADLLSFAQRSVALMEEAFGEYPFDYYRIAEIPDYVGAATAYPGVVFAREASVFKLDTRDSTKLNQVALMAAHETAHQWFAHIVQPAEIAGYTLLTETLAQYSEQLYIERYGANRGGTRQVNRHLRSHLAGQRDFYMGSRRYFLEEPPLIHVDGRGQAPISYQKGSLAMFAISRALTADTVNARLRRLVRDFRSPGRRATSRDLLAALLRDATPAQAAVVEDWLTRVLVYDVSVESATTVQLPDGRFETSVVIPASRFELVRNAGNTRNTGNTRITTNTRITGDTVTPEDLEETEMGEAVGIGLLRDHPDQSASLENPIALVERFVRTGTNTVKIATDERPEWVVVDPFGYLTDRDPYDNVVPVTVLPSAGE